MTLLEDIKIAIENPVTAAQHLKTVSARLKMYQHYDEVFIKQTYLKLYNAIKPDSIVIDLGGFVGDSAIYFAMNSNVKQVRVYEASPTNFHNLNANIKKSGWLKKIKTYNLAVCKKLGKIKNIRNEITGGNQVLFSPDGCIEAITLKEILKGLKNVVIKCDIEGAEYDLFKADLHNVYSVILEYHRGCYDNVNNDLKQAGFKVEMIKRNTNDGIIFANKKV